MLMAAAPDSAACSKKSDLIYSGSTDSRGTSKGVQRQVSEE